MRTGGKKKMFPEEYQCLRGQKEVEKPRRITNTKNQICRVSILFTTDLGDKVSVESIHWRKQDGERSSARPGHTVTEGTRA